MGRLTHTVSGSIATVRSPAVAPIESLKVHFSPIQEGTGDPSPSNIRPITGWTGVTATKVRSIWDGKYEKGYINASGQIVSNNDTFVNAGYINIIPNSKIKFRFTRTNISAANIHLFYYNENKEYITDRWIGPNGDINISANTRYIRFQMDTAYSATYDGKDLSVYYSDEAEIIPVTFPAVGKNLFNKDAEPYQTGKYITDSVSGIPQYSNNAVYNVYRIPIKPATTYTFGPIKGGSSGSGPIWATMNTNGITTRYIFNAGGSEGKYHTFTSYSSDAYLLLSVAVTNDYGYKCDDILQLEEGSSATTYEAFNNTIYGGYVDLATGRVIAQYKSVVFDGSEDEAWNNEYGDNYYIKLEDSKVNDTNYCNVAKYLPATSQLAVGGCKITGTLNFNIQIGNVIGINYDVPGFRDWLNQNNIQLVYALGNSKIIATLAPQELATFKGYSNFWSNAGDVDVTYQVVESSEMTKERQKIFAGNAPSIHTASGSVANFNMEPGLNRNLKSCKVGFLPVQEGSGDPFPPINQNGSIVGVDNLHNESELSSFKIHFSPIQAGSGDPSPTNVRPITGWTGVTGYKSGKSLLPFLKDSMSTAIDYNGYSGWQSKQYIDKSLKGAKVTYSAYIDATSVASGSGDNCVAIWAQDSNGTYILAGSRGNVIQPGNSGWSKVTLIIPVDTDWITFGLTLKTNGVASNPMVELGTEQTSYEAYSAPTSYPVSWESQGTVYGGYVDLVSGDVVNTYEIVDLGTLNYVYDSTAEQFVCYSGITFGDRDSFICSNYKTQSVVTYWTEMVDKTISGHSKDHTVFRIKDTDYTDAAAFKTAMDGVKLAYKLITPVKVGTISPTNVSLTNGAVHSFWSNADSVTIETAGNIRPIKGWQGVNTYSSGKNLLNVNRPYGTPDPTTLLVPNRIMDTQHCYVGSHPDGYYVSYYSSGSVSNGVITVSSFPNNSYGLGFPVSVKGGEKYTFNVTSSNNMVLIGTSYYDRDWNFIKNGGDIYQSMLPNKVLTTPDNAAYILIVFRSATNETYVYTNASFELGENGTSYEPYSGNVYSVKFPVQGKNLLDVSNITHGSYNIGSIPNILEPNTTYTFSVNGDTSKMYRLFATIEDFNTGVNYAISLNASYINKTSNLSFRTFTTPANIKDYSYLALAGNDSSAGNVPINDIKPQVELGSSATSYEPYDNLIFGGYVNLVTGEVWKTYGIWDCKDIDWVLTTSNNKKIWYATVNNMVNEDTLYCSGYKFEPTYSIGDMANSSSSTASIVRYTYNGCRLGIRDDYLQEITGSTIFKAAISGIKIVSKLATPVLVTTLTPTQIQALKGTNNILSDANGIIEVKYWSH